WRTNTFAPPIPWDLPTAGHFDGVGEHVREEQVRGTVNVSASLDRHVEWLAGYAELGFDELYLHFVGQEQAPFIDAFGAEVLPQVRAPGRSPAEPQLAAAAATPASDAPQ
ncbi:MAG: LLM class F420-dependent oxidoreductase, partial [Pseudarthrobacter sp.]|nr:LLM class F420-dependent oxidoreductase [Pseudarthrobacter sp.]